VYGPVVSILIVVTECLIETTLGEELYSVAPGGVTEGQMRRLPLPGVHKKLQVLEIHKHKKHVQVF
jgi:hypothetical protein